MYACVQDRDSACVHLAGLPLRAEISIFLGHLSKPRLRSARSPSPHASRPPSDGLLFVPFPRACPQPAARHIVSTETPSSAPWPSSPKPLERQPHHVDRGAGRVASVWDPLSRPEDPRPCRPDGMHP